MITKIVLAALFFLSLLGIGKYGFLPGYRKEITGVVIMRDDSMIRNVEIHGAEVHIKGERIMIANTEIITGGTCIRIGPPSRDVYLEGIMALDCRIGIDVLDEQETPK